MTRLKTDSRVTTHQPTQALYIASVSPIKYTGTWNGFHDIHRKMGETTHLHTACSRRRVYSRPRCTLPGPPDTLRASPRISMLQVAQPQTARLTVWEGLEITRVMQQRIADTTNTSGHTGRDRAKHCHVALDGATNLFV